MIEDINIDVYDQRVTISLKLPRGDTVFLTNQRQN